MPGYAIHAELQMLIEAGLKPEQAIRTASLNVAEAWGKEKDFGSVEKGKVADLVIVGGDVMKDVSATQNVGKKSFSTAKRWTGRFIRTIAIRFRGRCRTVTLPT